MYSLFNVNIFLFYRNYSIFRLANPNKAWHKIIPRKSENLSCILTLVPKRYSQIAAISFCCCGKEDIFYAAPYRGKAVQMRNVVRVYYIRFLFE